MRDLCCADDGRRHRFLLVQPGQRYMNARQAMLLREFFNPLYDRSIVFGGRIVFAFLDLIGFGTQRAFG